MLASLRTEIDRRPETDESSTISQFLDSLYVVFADIAGCYEGILLETLSSDLRQLGTPTDTTGFLSRLLNKWVCSPGRGIPQGHSPSDILAKVYLNRVDEQLRDLGLRHIRYVDDYRILCSSAAEAKRAIADLSKMLRHRGLSLQSAKTEILTSEQTAAKVGAIANTLTVVRDEFIREIRVAHDLGMGDYVPLHVAEALILDNQAHGSVNPEKVPVEIIEDAYSDNFIINGAGEDPAGRKLDRTLFHFLLNQLGKLGSNHAVQDTLELIATNPEETECILKYVERLGYATKTDDSLAKYLSSADAIYSHQVYEVALWRVQQDGPPSAELVASLRPYAFDGQQPSYVRAACLVFLGRFGTSGDLERIAQMVPTIPDPLEQSVALLSLQRMEKQRRSSLFARYPGVFQDHCKALVNNDSLFERIV